MKLGIVGLPNVGKSTLFNALTKAGAESANYPFCTIEPNVGVVAVPDKRLDVLRDMYNSKKVLPAVVEFVDIAGLIKGASKGEGLGNQFLSHIREVDAIVQVVRCFDDDNIIHVDKTVDPIRDIETINLELIFSDMEQLERRIAKNKKMAKSDKTAASEIAVLEKLYEHLESGQSARSFDVDNEDDVALINSIGLISSKPVLYAANVCEEDLTDGVENGYVKAVKMFASTDNSEVFIICAQIEQELADLEEDEKLVFLEDLGITDTGFDKLIAASYKLLGLISYLTAGPQEVRAWTITKGTKAPGAAGKIHSDFERGFIRAEVVHYDDLTECGSYTAAKEKGVVGVEGKEYVVKDGDIILFRFNV
ncbi:MAG: GTP-binding protein [Epulopiscium sp. Nele67-Bin002]|nr:MAG: redox-regulated ATPase YchF [Epulopiscium sp. Nuni2H_MBin001]OON91499.1 MAG: GTP-binding protein [Epulopiscium sp. Nele67-Bin002]OON94616.1 MAG: redox-regulated ATPase YchF [Epulopiscium sp. Nele67-Bin001]